MQKRTMVAASKRLLQRSLVKCLMSWQAWTAHKVSVRHIGVKVISRLKSARTAEALDAWCSWSTERRRLRKTATRIIARMKHGLCARALGSWAHHCRTMARVHQMVVRLLHRVTMGCFERWCEEMIAVGKRKALELHQSDVESFQAALRASEEEMQKRTMVAASKRLLQRSLVKCLMSWQAWTAHKVSVRHLSVWMCHRLLHRQLSMAFIVWQDWLVSQVQAKRAAAKAVLHLAHGMCTRALNAWLAATRTQTTHQRTMTRVILRLHNRRAAEALDAWCSWSTEHRRLRKTGTRIIARMQHGLCARALGSWAHHCRTMARAHRMIVRWKNRVTMECFERWCEEMAATRKLTAADLQLENTQQINAEFEEERVKDKRNIQFLEALVDELFQALETGTIDASEPLDLGDQPTRTSTRYPSSSASHGNSASAAGGSTARRAAGGSAARRKSPPESVPPPRLGLSPYR